jgi:hypothetical protein
VKCDNTPRGVRAIDPNTSALVATFPNLRAVAKVGRNPGDVWMCTVGRRHTHHGLRWIRDPVPAEAEKRPQPFQVAA